MVANGFNHWSSFINKKNKIFQMLPTLRASPLWGD
jgi:hypothetical protein